MNRNFSKAVILSIVAGLTIMMSISGLAQPPLKVLDTYNVGVNDREKLAAGWSEVQPSSEGPARQVWEKFWAGQPEQNSDNARSASFMLSQKGGNAKSLSLRHFDGAFDDSFDVNVNGLLIFHYTADPSLVSWVTTDVPLPANIGADVDNGLKTYNVVIKATGAAYPGLASTGQVAFHKIDLMGTD